MFVNKNSSPVVCKVGFLHEEESTNKRYQQYFEWLRDRISDDKMEVKSKDLVYLQSTYDRLYRQAVEELTPEKKRVQLCVIQASSECSEKLKQFIEKSERLYDIATRYDNNDGYRYYDRMGSWYNSQIRTTTKVLDNVSKMAKESDDMQRKLVRCIDDEWNEKKTVHVKVLKNTQVVMFF